MTKWMVLGWLLCAVAAVAQKPVITKIDPPNWWPSLPDPMLLVYGENLRGAEPGQVRFTVTGRGVSVARSETSENGHYAFLWLKTQGAAAQRVEIQAKSRDGLTKAEFELKRRAPAAGRYQGFSAKDVMYLVMTDRFADGDAGNNQPGFDRGAARGWHGGDFKGIEDHLDYLQSLGVTALWTTPAYSNGVMPESYHGYAATDLYAVDGHFGTLKDYQHLAAALHARGMKAVLDIVPNHIGVEHVWVHDPPMPDWFHGTFERHTRVRFNFEALMDPHAAPADFNDITHGWFTDGMPDMNQENPVVAKYLTQNAMWWVESAGLDGLRIDTFPYVGRAFWRDFHRELHAAYPRLTTVGEVFHADANVTSYFAGGVSREGIDTGLDTPFDFPMYFTLRDVLLRDKPMTAVTAVLGADHLYPHAERLVPFFGNHDTKRFLSEAGASRGRLKLAFGLAATLRGMPEIYSGDEIAMEGGEDPDNRRDFPGGMPGASHSAFTEAGRTEAEQEMFAWSSGLLHLRAAHAAITEGGQQDVFADATGLAFVRARDAGAGCGAGGARDRLLVVMTKAAQGQTIKIPQVDTGLAGCKRFEPLFPRAGEGSKAELKIEGASVSVTLPADGFAIYSVQ